MRWFDWLVISLLALVFAGLALYHYERQDYAQQNDEKLQELARQPFVEDRTVRFDWPQWRGPHRDGVSTETDLLKEWPKEGPPLLWKKPLGEGYASFAVVKGRLFTLCREAGKEAIVCFDAVTGKEIWRHTYACDYKSSYGSGPRSTPSIAGDFIYTVGATGIMHCLKAFSDNPLGEIVWTKDLLKEFSAPPPQWGVAFSPLVEGERVFIQPGGPAGNSLAALDRQTGAIVWKKFDDEASYSSPLAATILGEQQILFFTGLRLVSVDPATGRRLWDYPWITDYQCNIATPISAPPNYVFISSGYDRGCAVLEINKAAAWQVSLLNKNRRMRNHFSSCVRDKKILYGFDDSNLTCMSLGADKMHWKERGFGKGSVLLVNDHLLIYGENGVLALAEANPSEYREKSRFQFSTEGGPCWSVPVIANGRLYVRDAKKVACFNVKAALP